MHSVIKNIPVLYPLAKAEALAESLNANDEDWTYVVHNLGNGKAKIEIVEDGEHIAWWSI